ncbi:hypothetical protein EJD97_009289 [Solanum chilense]|uniref:CCHC-type domain-containing protein n=1 Tax=Solanum chilense TaxID=4083 RepID=A0A6N2AIB9_SOLCI|nr:hypothetical protein EJD97_009289 [Solanum chilense]
MGYIGEDITDGRWQKIDYDNIPDYCFYCKHQGHKETDCIVKKRDEENKQRKDKDRNKNSKDSTHTNNVGMQTSKYVETGRMVDHTQQTNANQQQVVQEEWHTQRRKNANQQVKFHTDRAVQPPPQTGIVSIPTKNTYIDLEVQEFTTVEQGMEQIVDQSSKQATQQIIPSNRQSQSYDYNAGAKEYQEQRKDYQNQGNRMEQAVYQQERINRTGIDSMLPTPTPLHIGTDIVGVAVGGKDGSGQVDNVLNPVRIDKGKENREDTGTSYQNQQGPMLHNSNVEEIRDVTEKQGLSPRGRKLVKQSKNTSISRPNTRAKSRGL